jgi:hypothetical protein
MKSKYSNKLDSWTWRQAHLNDIDQMVMSAVDYFQPEVEHWVQPDSKLFAKSLAISIVNQKHSAVSEQLIVAEQDNKILAYAWIQRGVYMPYSYEEIAEAKFVNILPMLSTRKKLALLTEILAQWELWATIANVSCICSSSVLVNQEVFLKLHKQAGYDVRGSICFKRLKGERNE